jgi:uncharacterized protein
VNLFADSSALVKRYLADEHSDNLDEVLQGATNLAVAVLCPPEIISALCRRRRERFITKAQYEAAKTALESDLADTTVIQIIDAVVLQTLRLLEAHPLRASEAIQVASALVWGADKFISADARQCAAAKASGLSVIRLY